MNLFDLIAEITPVKIQGDDVEIHGMTIDSRTVQNDFLFVCIKGLHNDSHDYIDRAIAQGAKAIVVERSVSVDQPGVTVIQVQNSREALASIASQFYGGSQNKMTMIGVTGTNGKTSTTYFIQQILRGYEKNVGVIGTNGLKINEAPLEIPFATSTTPDTIELMYILSEMAKSVSHVAMEVSSHALDLNKVNAIAFDVSVFTNLTQDHLDYHHTMENYLAAKAKLFAQSAISVINIDDPYGADMVSAATGKIRTYGIHGDADLKARHVQYATDQVSYDVEIDDIVYNFTIHIPGQFTVYNTLAAIGACMAVGVPVSVIQTGLARIQGVPGRIQSVPNQRGFHIFVDYAHSPDGLENILQSVQAFTKGKIITVFGCGGDRDRTKRPIMGKIAGQHSDYCIITSDNPRSENPESIIEEVEKGILETACPYEKISDRQKAIDRAIAIGEKEDSIIIAGKGHETYQIFANETIHFDDLEAVLRALEE